MNLPHKTSFHRESDTLFRCSKAPDSAPEIAPGRFWCKKECFSAPKITFSRKWCQNEAFSAPKPPASRKQKNQLFSWFFVRAKGHYQRIPNESSNFSHFSKRLPSTYVR